MSIFKPRLFKLAPLLIFMGLVVFLAIAAMVVMYHYPDGGLPPVLGSGDQDLLLPSEVSCPPNRPCIVFLSAPWCETCDQQAAFLQHSGFKKQAENLGFHVVYVMYKPKENQPPLEASALAHDFEIDPKGRLTLALGGQGFPEAFVADKQRKIIYHHKGPILDTASLRQFFRYAISN